MHLKPNENYFRGSRKRRSSQLTLYEISELIVTPEGEKEKPFIMPCTCLLSAQLEQD
jgi:hypothetical protein